jgi:hypothetical protein
MSALLRNRGSSLQFRSPCTCEISVLVPPELLPPIHWTDTSSADKTFEMHLGRDYAGRRVETGGGDGARPGSVEPYLVSAEA